MKHETRNTTAILVFCNTCNRRTLHRVDDRRVGACLEHEAKGSGAAGCSQKQINERKKRDKEEKEPRLF